MDRDPSVHRKEQQERDEDDKGPQYAEGLLSFSFETAQASNLRRAWIFNGMSSRHAPMTFYLYKRSGVGRFVSHQLGLRFLDKASIYDVGVKLSWRLKWDAHSCSSLVSDWRCAAELSTSANPKCWPFIHATRAGNGLPSHSKTISSLRRGGCSAFKRAPTFDISIKIAGTRDPAATSTTSTFIFSRLAFRASAWRFDCRWKNIGTSRNDLRLPHRTDLFKNA